MNESEIKYFFTYGTLAPGRENHHHVKHIDGVWLRATVRGRLVNQGWGASMGFPALIVDDNGDWVEGWALKSNDLANHWVALDSFEGEEYLRTPVPIRLESTEVVLAFVYLANDSN